MIAVSANTLDKWEHNALVAPQEVNWQAELGSRVLKAIKDLSSICQNAGKQCLPVCCSSTSCTT